MIEFHVDVHRIFQDIIYLTEFGGNETLRKPKYDKYVSCLGAKKTILIKETYTSRRCSGYNGDQTLIPNSEGMELIVSEIQYCEFGFGF